MGSTLKIENYHTFSLMQEAKEEKQLIPYFKELIDAINSLQQLNDIIIDQYINNWKAKNNNIISNIILINIIEAEQYVNKLFKNNHVNESLIQDLAFASLSMLEILVSKIRDKFMELAILENYYNLNDNQSTSFVQQILDVTLSGISTFVAQSNINNMRKLLTSAGQLLGYTEGYYHTQRDSKVRPTHAALDGKWFPLNNPPSEMLDYNCRCWFSKFR